MLLYDLLDIILPYRSYKIRSTNINYYKFSIIHICQGFNWDHKKYGWTFYVHSSSDVHIPHSPQDRSIHSERNTSGEAYTIVYKRWRCLIKRIKEEYENVDVELLE